MLNNVQIKVYLMNPIVKAQLIKLFFAKLLLILVFIYGGFNMKSKAELDSFFIIPALITCAIFQDLASNFISSFRSVYYNIQIAPIGLSYLFSYFFKFWIILFCLDFSLMCIFCFAEYYIVAEYKLIYILSTIFFFNTSLVLSLYFPRKVSLKSNVLSNKISPITFTIWAIIYFIILLFVLINKNIITVIGFSILIFLSFTFILKIRRDFKQIRYRNFNKVFKS